MKEVKMGFVALLVLLGISACSANGEKGADGSDAAFKTTAVPSGYSLVWSDEFTTAGQPSTANWNYHVGNGYNIGSAAMSGWGNGEWQWYRPGNCYVENDNLVIKGEYSTTPLYTFNGTSYYQRSGRITTRGKKEFQYGYIEARIKNPTVQGNWTAFWMLGSRGAGDTYTSSYTPADSYYDTMVTNWASCGEIDIMEHCAATTTGNNYCFWDTRTGVYPWTSGMNGDYGTTTAAYGDPTAYHVYGLLWTATSMTWYVDGVQTWTIDTTATGLEEFQNPFYFVINMAIGGSLAGNVDTANWPAYMYVDYVRVYQTGTTTSSSSASSSAVSSAASSTATSSVVSSTAVSSAASSAASSSSTTTFTYGATRSGTTTTIYFKPGWTSSWVDVHYIYNNGGQQNFRMTYNTSTARWEQKVTGTASGKVLKYYFTYEKGGLAYDTAWYSKTL